MDMRIIRIMFIALTLMQTAMDTAFGGDSQTIGVSCIIPAIPGVNAPLSDGQTLIDKTQAIQEEEINVQREQGQQETPAWIEQNTQVASQNEDGSTRLAAIKTYYSR